MSVLDRNGKNATPGLPCIYTLLTGQTLYSEKVKEDSDSYVFDAEHTLNVVVQPKGSGRADLAMQKLSDDVFGPKQVRILKSAVLSVTDCGRPELIAKAKEALSGIVLAGPGAN